MQCGQCGAVAGAGQRFCGQCGAPLAVRCPSCDHENPPDHRFCGACGNPLPSDSHPAVAAVERRVVSVLFVDLVGFTSYSEGRDPEEVRRLITEYFDVARQVVERFGGTVDKFIGDAVMAWWGATTSQEDDAERAVRCALELVDRVVTLGEQRGIGALTARAGVMTGEVSVGPGGNERGLLLGDLVNSTSRLQSLAESGSVFIGAGTAALVAEGIETTPAGTHRVKGRDEPLEVFRAVRVLGERGGRGRSEALEPPFVGRLAELRLLKDTLQATGQERRARLVSLVGQAGIGKSRLVWEFRKYVDGLVDDVYWHEGRSPAYGDGLALWALGEMIRRRAGIQETDDDDVTATRLSESVAAYVVDDEERHWVEERLRALLGLGEGVGSDRTELYAAARAFFEGVAERGTTVLVFEDLHWADPGLLEFIEELLDWSQNHPFMVVTLARPDLLDRRPDWGSGRRGLSSSYLGPLADQEMAELISGAVPGIPDGAVRRIVDAAGGVPLFAVEMVRMLLAEGRVVAGPDGVVLTDDLSEIEVPTSVQAVVAARLDRLPTAAREIARDAAVLGHSFTLHGLAALRSEEPDKLERLLGDLVRREIMELVRDTRSPERGQYRWVQSVLREVAYGRVSRRDRHELHLRAARYFRSLEEPELDPVAAAHFVAATEYADERDVELEAELVVALRAAIDRARALHAHQQILSLVATAFPVVPDVVEVDLRETAARSAVRLADIEAAHQHVARLRTIADRLDDLSVLHRAVALAGLVNNELRQSDRARAILEPHLEAHPDLESDRHLARAAVYLARARLLTGDDAGAAELADRALGAVERFAMLEEIADALVTRGTAMVGHRPHQAMALLRGALEMSRSHDLVDTRLRALINIGYASADFDENLAATREAFEEAKRVGDRAHASFVAGNLTGSYMYLMDFDAAEDVLADPVWSDTPADRIHSLGAGAGLRLRRGDLQGAERLLEEGRELVSGITDTQVLMGFERAQAELDLFDGEYRSTFAMAERHLGSSFAPFLAVEIAVISAAMEGDADLLRRAGEMAASMPDGVLAEPLALIPDAMLELVGGDADAGVERLEHILTRLMHAKMRWPAFLTALAAARALPGAHPARDRFGAMVRELADQASAPGLATWIDRTLA